MIGVLPQSAIFRLKVGIIDEYLKKQNGFCFLFLTSLFPTGL